MNFNIIFAVVQNKMKCALIVRKLFLLLQIGLLAAPRAVPKWLGPIRSLLVVLRPIWGHFSSGLRKKTSQWLARGVQEHGRDGVDWHSLQLWFPVDSTYWKTLINIWQILPQLPGEQRNRHHNSGCLFIIGYFLLSLMPYVGKTIILVFVFP